MRSILLSFEPEWFKKLELGKTKFEYRKMLPDEECTVYFYVSRPVKAISGVAHFGKRQNLSSWLDIYSDRPEEVIDRIKDYMTDCNYAAPILDFQRTNYIGLNQIKDDIPSFVVPRMYYYIDGSQLEKYLCHNLIKVDKPIVFSHDNISNNDICI